jgi:hypothetical protein
VREEEHLGVGVADVAEEVDKRIFAIDNASSEVPDRHLVEAASRDGVRYRHD